MTSTTTHLGPRDSRLLSPVEGAADRVDGFLQLAWEHCDPILLELCRLNLAAMLKSDAGRAKRTALAKDAGLTESKIVALARWHKSDLFSACERACLALSEQFATDVSGVDRASIDDLLQWMSPEEAFRFVCALAIVEEHLRLSLVLEGVFVEENQ